MIHVDWSNPYRNQAGVWLKGNLHTHTSPASHCGKVLLHRMVKLYLKAGYDFVSISDHCSFTPCREKGIITIPGMEWNSSHGEHTGIYSLHKEVFHKAVRMKNHDRLLHRLRNKDAVVILNHPDWQLIPHYRRKLLEKKRFFDGIEIYNGVIERLKGEALSTGKWDYLLVNNKKVLGFASDDAHLEL